MKKFEWTRPVGGVAVDDAGLIEPIGEGVIYCPDDWSALWRRIADDEHADAPMLAGKWGPLVDVSGDRWKEPAVMWLELHEFLSDVSSLWSREDESGRSILEKSKIKQRVSYETEDKLVMLRHDKQLSVGQDGLVLYVRPETLKAYLICSVARCLNDDVKFRRCSHCGEWFEAGRSDALFCSPAHRIAAHRDGGSNGKR